MFKLFDNPVLVTFGSVAAAVLIVVTTTIFFSQILENKRSNNLDLAIEDLDPDKIETDKEEFDFEGIYRAKTEKEN